MQTEGLWVEEGGEETVSGSINSLKIKQKKRRVELTDVLKSEIQKVFSYKNEPHIGHVSPPGLC